MRISYLLSGTMLFAVAVLAIALPLMAVSTALAMEFAPVVGVDLRGSLLGSVVGIAIILASFVAASKGIDVYLSRQTA